MHAFIDSLTQSGCEELNNSFTLSVGEYVTRAQ